MFELLLQADRAMSDGLLEQAERTYWQLIELDPTNAMAVAGLARVWLERGDERSARTFADQALGIDPYSIAARRVIDTLDHVSVETNESEPAELPMLGAQRLEALSRRRVVGSSDAEGGAQQTGAAKTDAARTRGSASAGQPGANSGTRPPAESVGRPSASPRRGASGKETRGRTRPDQIGPLPPEPLRDRRQAGRLAAAAAAAAAAAREPVRPRHDQHHAMPIGRRRFEPEDLKTPPADAFSAAEMAAAVEAIDAVDEAEERTFVSTEKPPARTGDSPAADGAAEAAADTTEQASTEAALEIDAYFEAHADEFEAAEAIASSQAGREFGPRQARATVDPVVEPIAPSVEPDEPAAAAEQVPVEAARTEAAPAKPVEAADATAGEYEARPARRSGKHSARTELSEEEAEAQALREALATVLEAESQAAGQADISDRNGARGTHEHEQPGPQPAGSASEQPAGSASEQPAGSAGPQPAESAQVPDAPTPDDAEPASGHPTPEPPRRKGLFRRFRSN